MNLYRIPALIVFAVLCSLSSLTAQQILYSPYEKFDFRTGEFTVAGKVGNLLYVYRGSAEGYYLDAYNDAMQKQATVILDFLPRRSFGTRFITYSDKIIVLYQVTESNQVVQYASLLDAKGRLLKDPMVIDEVKSSFLGGRSGLYNCAISHNKRQIVVYGVNTRGAELKARMIWLDDALNKHPVVEAPFSADNDVTFGEGVVNDDGEFLLPAYTPYGARDYADRVWLLGIKQGDKAFQPVEMPINDLFTAGTYMEMSLNGDKVYVGGFYSDRKNGNFEGIIYTYYDVAEKTFKEFKTISFSERMRNATGERSLKRAFNDYQVRRLIVRNDGGFVLIAEDFFITTRNNYNQGFGYYSWYYPTMSASVREYNYGDILAISCNGNGQPEWAEFIRKMQYSQEDGGLFSSYALLNTGGALGFLFNDFNASKSKIQLASLESNGKITVNALTGYSNEDPDWLPKSGKQVSAREFVVPCLKRNQICFAKVVF